MRHTTRQYLSTLDTETLITIIEGLCGFGGFDVNHGPFTADGKPIVYGSHHLHGTFTLANVDEKSVPKWAETGTVRFACNNLWKPEKNTAIMSLQFDTEDNLPPDVQAQELVNNINDTTYFRVNLESVIPADNGCGCMQDPPCKGCKRDSQPIPDAVDVNRLHLFKVYTIASDLTESDPVFVMARHEEGAAALFHKARARDQENILCEVIISKVQDAEMCDE